MEKDEVVQVLTEKGIQFDPEATLEDLQALVPKEPKDQEDYRAKLNIQNRFLEKEGYEFKDGLWVKKPQAEKPKPDEKRDELSAKDALLLAKAEVDMEDVDEVVEYARFRKVSIADALKNPMLTGLLKERKEERATAAAASTGKQRTAPTQVSDDVILAQARGGNLPESADEIQKLVDADLGRKLKK